MSIMCAYHDCLCVKYPCSSIAFFRLPTDDRRSTWIKNSGNKSLIKINATAHRFFCEYHFRQCDIRTQFNRKILRKNAVPIEHESCKFASNSETSNVSLANYSRQSKDNHQANLVVEKLGDGSRTMQLYEEVELPELKNSASENLTEEKIDDSYIQVFYSPVEGQFEEPETITGYSSGEESLEKSFEEISYEETNGNVTDCSTLPEPIAEDLSEGFKQTPVKKRKANEAQATTSKDYEEDKHFALSLVGYFQRLPKGEKALAKLKILQYLTELEIGLQGDVLN